ncbi:MAG: metallophosphoesterase [Actinobacteria bacterium]|nr:metallophosphoesterase [Actinomycetota bacterium]
MKKAPINRDRIKQVIYPTLGYPAIIKHGEHLTLEFDPRNQDWSKALPQITGFQVLVTTTNSVYPATRVLPVRDFTVGFSTHWPEYSQRIQPRARVYLVTVAVPETVPMHLYNLTVTGTQKDGSMLIDSQPHALQVVNEYKTDYIFAHMTDIHVWGQEAAYVGSSTHERGWRLQEYSETEGYGAIYYHKSIQQMNRAKPDFLVYTGDYDFGLTWLYKQNYADFDAYKNSPWSDEYYETWFEMDWFYTETLKLNVPVFMVPGNHDGWARYDQLNVSLEEDYLAS